jgi:hypothetical protein
MTHLGNVLALGIYLALLYGLYRLLEVVGTDIWNFLSYPYLWN